MSRMLAEIKKRKQFRNSLHIEKKVACLRCGTKRGWDSSCLVCMEALQLQYGISAYEFLSKLGGASAKLYEFDPKIAHAVMNLGNAFRHMAIDFVGKEYFDALGIWPFHFDLESLKQKP